MIFTDLHKNVVWENERESIYKKTESDVEQALKKNKRDLEDFKALISPAAAPYLETMANLSNKLTMKRFGKTVQMYIPIYLSNECSNHCVYCGFNHANKIDRITLNDEQILAEMEVVKSYGFQHVLLVTGEHKTKAGVEYLKHAIQLLKPHFSLISLEVQPLETEEYKILAEEGLNTVYVYQETYNKLNYNNYHPKGKKADFNYRLETPDRLGNAGVHKIGLGVLLGLEDWRTDTFFTALHLKYLEKNYWKTKYSISFPRLRPHEGGFVPNHNLTERELVQLICAYRIFDEEVELSISVRESPKFRDNCIKFGITSMSAGSKTEPGGYTANNKALKQFMEDDQRSPSEIMQMIKQQGYEVVWKDWDKFLQ